MIGRAKREFGLDSMVMLYDTTNFFTLPATANTRAKLSARGNSKAKRHDLRQVGLALLVTRDYQIPVLHHVYEDHILDVKLFPLISRQISIGSEASRAAVRRRHWCSTKGMCPRMLWNG